MRLAPARKIISAGAVENLLQRPCPVCDASETAPFMAKAGLRLARCRRCEMIFANPVNSDMALGTFYNDAGQEYLSADKLAGDYAAVRFERELRWFRNYCPRGSVLDVGCSSGGFLYQLQQRHPGDYKILGMDVSTAPLNHAAQMNVPVCQGDFLTHPFAKQFDAITFWAVMEHLFAPQLFLRRAADLLRPGGICFILVPNFNSLAVRLLGAKYRYIFPEHLNYFTPATLERFAGREFLKLRLDSTHFNPLVIWHDFRRGARAVPRAERASLLKRTTAYKNSRWLFPLRVAYRGAEKCLGRNLLADNLLIVSQKARN